jgi:hypothetical protein
VSTPGSAAYGKHLSPSHYTARYGATAAQASAARAWLRSEGFTGIDPAIHELACTRTGAFHDALPVTSATLAAYQGVACDAYYCRDLGVMTFDDLRT